MNSEGLHAWQSLCQLEPMLSNHAVRAVIPSGQTLFQPGFVCDNYLFIIQGTVRVDHLSEDGREIVLYRLKSGETCVITTACLLSGEVYTAQGITETVVIAMAVPKNIFNQLLNTSPVFRDLVFTTFGQRITSLMSVIEAVAFQRIEKRLSKRLLDLSDQENIVRLSHQDLAVELGSAREVISRRLKEWEKTGLVTLQRGCITLTNLAALKDLANGTSC